MFKILRQIAGMNTRISRSHRNEATRPVQNLASEHKAIYVQQNTNPAIKYSFASHIAKYTGQTVTIFVTAGGISGMGFTGILLSVNHSYVRLITGISPAPAYSLGNTCSFPAHGYYGFNLYSDNCGMWTNSGIKRTLGSIACIPVNRIASFVHI